MKEGALKYYEDCDVLYFFLKKGEEKEAIEVAPGVTLELNEQKEIIGIEILDASKFLNSYILKNFKSQLDEQLAGTKV